MKLASRLCLIALFVATACQDQSKPSSASAGASGATNNSTTPLEAPASYLGALAKGQQAAVKTVDTASIDQAIQLFAVDKGRNPKDLNELVQEKFLPRIPGAPYGMKIVYDPASGTVKVVKQ